MVFNFMLFIKKEKIILSRSISSLKIPSKAFFFLIFNWGTVALQCCFGSAICVAAAGVSTGITFPLSPEPPSHPPTPPGCHRAQVELFGHKANAQVALVVKNLPANAGDARDMGSIPGGGKRQPTPVFLPENFHGQKEPSRRQSMGSQMAGHN